MTVRCPNGHESDSTDYCDICGAPIPEGVPAPAASSGNSLDLPAPGAESAVGAPDGGGPKMCPNCQTENVPESLFCEACGYDFTTGALPAGAGSSMAPMPLTAPDESAGLSETGGALGAEEPHTVPDGAAHPDEASASLDAPSGGAGGESVAGITPSAATGGVPPRIAFQWVVEVWIDPDWYADQQADEPLPSAGLPLVVPLRVASALIGRHSASRNIRPDIDCSSDPGVSRRHAQLTTDGSRWFVEDLQSANGTFVGPASGPLPDDPIPVGPKTEVGDSRIYVGAWTRIVVRRATDEEIAVG